LQLQLPASAADAMIAPMIKTPKPRSTRKRGRPTAYTPALGRAICERLANGEPLLAICEADDMPDRITVWRWNRQRDEFRNMILAAREFGADALAEQCLQIADGSGDTRRDLSKISTRRWLASKIAPRRYGDRLATEVSGPDGSPVEFEGSGAGDADRGGAGGCQGVRSGRKAAEHYCEVTRQN
jgi:hypothetical protein